MGVIELKGGMNTFNRWLTIVLIGLGALLIQAHAVPYWTMRIGHTGSHLLPWNGWGWSLLLLLVEIALWPRKDWASRLGDPFPSTATPP